MSEREDLTVGELEQLQALHDGKHLRLITSEGLQGYAHLNEDPEALVTELLRLAVFAAHVRATAKDFPRREAQAVIREANLRASGAMRAPRQGGR